jgi:hypothetical protein
MAASLRFSLFPTERATCAQELASGVIFANGKVALASGPAVAIYEDFTAMATERCGDGKTRLVWNYEEMAYWRHLLPQFASSDQPADAAKEK